MSSRSDSGLGFAIEQLRLTIAIAIVATAVGAYMINSDEHVLAPVFRGFVTLPGLMLGLYVLFTASHLKYKRPAEIGELSIPEKIRRSCYDQGINLFWVMLFIYVFIFSASLTGWDGDMSKFLNFWPSFVVSFLILLLLMLTSVFMADKEKMTKIANQSPKRVKHDKSKI